jgi:Tol biopolymer transport system component/mono/diheme cytochrome c family protein
LEKSLYYEESFYLHVFRAEAMMTYSHTLLFISLCLLAGCLAACAASELPPVPDPTMLRQQQATDDFVVTLDSSTDPQTNQLQQLQIYLRNQRGEPLDPMTVQLDLAMPMLCVSGSTPTVQRLATGRYAAEALYPMSGSWNVTIIVEQDGQRHQAVFPMQVREDAASILRNPLATDLNTIPLGQAIYARQCASCHGTNGQGDGPAATRLQPPPSNLTQHLTVGKHSDGEVFRWIRHGIPGSAMPAQGGQLTETEIWQVVTYLRTLAVTAPIAEVNEPLPPLVFVRAGQLWQSDGTSPVVRPLPTMLPIGGVTDPVFAPDGQRIAVIVNRSTPISETGRFTVPSLYILDSNGSNAQVIWDAPAYMLAEPAWARDGTALYLTARSFTGSGDGGGSIGSPQIVRVDLATGQRTTIWMEAASPAISADGTHLAFVAQGDTGATNALMIASLTGETAWTVVSDPRFQQIAAPRFAPDGQRLVFAAAGGPPVDSAGVPVAYRSPSLLEQLTKLVAPSSAQAHGGNWEIWSIQTDGTQLRRLTTLATHDPVAAFSPDGSQVAIASEEGIHLMQLDGALLRQLDATMATDGIDWASVP